MAPPHPEPVAALLVQARGRPRGALSTGGLFPGDPHCVPTWCSPKGANPPGQGSIRLTSCNPSHLPKASPPNTVPLGVRASTRGGGQTRSVCNKGKPLPAGAGRSYVRAPPQGLIQPPQAL